MHSDGNSHKFSLQKIRTRMLEQKHVLWRGVVWKGPQAGSGQSSRSDRWGTVCGSSARHRHPSSDLRLGPLQEILSLGEDLYTDQSGQLHRAPGVSQSGLTYLPFLTRERKRFKRRHTTNATNKKTEFSRHSSKELKQLDHPEGTLAQEGASFSSACCCL